jgi:hypothetical protein
MDWYYANPEKAVEIWRRTHEKARNEMRQATLLLRVRHGLHSAKRVGQAPPQQPRVVTYPGKVMEHFGSPENRQWPETHNHAAHDRRIGSR